MTIYDPAGSPGEHFGMAALMPGTTGGAVEIGAAAGGLRRRNMPAIRMGHSAACCGASFTPFRITLFFLAAKPT